MDRQCGVVNVSRNIPRDVVQRMLEEAYRNGRVDSASQEPYSEPEVSAYERMALEAIGVLEEEPDAPIPRDVVQRMLEEAEELHEAFAECGHDARPGEPEPKDTLLACMRWCDDRDQEAWVKRRGWLDDYRIILDVAGGIAFRHQTDCGSLAHSEVDATDWLLSTDKGASWFSPSKGPEVEPAYDPREDKIKRAMLAAAERFGGGDGTFNLANFQSSVEELAGSMPTGDMCKLMLSGRVDVQQLSPGDAHYRVHIKPPLGEPPEPEVEPKSGAELRRWLHGTGRKARGVGGMADCLFWFDREACCFLVDWNGDGQPKRAHWPDPEQGIPADGGTWESEGE